MKRTIYIGVVGLILSFVFNYAYAQEKITLSTYYPAPYGEYRKLAIGSSAGGYTAPTSANIDLVVEGGVGIGTTSPVAKLEVESTTAGTAGLFIDGSAGDTWFPYTNGWNYISGNGVIFRNSANVEKMRIDATTGNVGIGTTGPSEKLEVNGAIKVGNTTGTNAGTIRWTGTAFEGYNGSEWVPLGGGGSISRAHLELAQAVSDGTLVNIANGLGPGGSLTLNQSVSEGTLVNIANGLGPGGSLTLVQAVSEGTLVNIANALGPGS